MSIDPNSKVAYETLVTTDTVIISGEITSEASLNLIDIAKNVIKEIVTLRRSIFFQQIHVK